MPAHCCPNLPWSKVQVYQKGDFYYICICIVFMFVFPSICICTCSIAVSIWPGPQRKRISEGDYSTQSSSIPWAGRQSNCFPKYLRNLVKVLNYLKKVQFLLQILSQIQSCQVLNYLKKPLETCLLSLLRSSVRPGGRIFIGLHRHGGIESEKDGKESV